MSKTKRQVVEQAQGMADYEHAVMLVISQDREYFIRRVSDYDGPAAARITVIPPTGTYNGYSAAGILAELGVR